MICIPGCGAVHGSAVSCEEAQAKRNRSARYEVRFNNGLWWVWRGDECVTRGWVSPEIAEDYARALNIARFEREAQPKAAPAPSPAGTRGPGTTGGATQGRALRGDADGGEN